MPQWLWYGRLEQPLKNAVAVSAASTAGAEPLSLTLI